MSQDRIRIQVWTERFLGTRAKGEELLLLLHSLDSGLWVPDKWDHFEPVRKVYQSSAKEEIISALTEVRGGRISNQINFIKVRPRADFSLNVSRSRVEDMNRIYVALEASIFSNTDSTARILAIVRDLVNWSEAVFSSARHSRQEHWRVAQGTPRQRISQMDWITFFGKPYMNLFGGKERVQLAPCYAVEDLRDGLLLLASPKADSPEMIESDRLLLNLEEYLGIDAFAGRGYPQIPCRVPTFDLSETVFK